MQTRDYPLTTWKRFWAKVEEGDGGCWNWTASLTGGGYGQFWAIPNGCRRPAEKIDAHRFAYVSLVGPIADGLHLDHLCRNRACINPAHLEPVTPAENILRGVGASALNARKTHCIHGHELSPENVYMDRRNRRHCIECRRRRSREIMARARAEGRVEHGRIISRANWTGARQGEAA